MSRHRRASNSGVQLRLRAGRVSLQRNVRVDLSKEKMLAADGAVIVAELLQQPLQCASELQQVKQEDVLLYSHTMAEVCKA